MLARRLTICFIACAAALILPSSRPRAAEQTSDEAEPVEQVFNYAETPIIADGSLWKTAVWLVPGAFVDLKATGVDAQLGMFCETGCVQDRCLESPFVGPAETFLINHLTEDEAFCREFGISPEQGEKLRARRREELIDVPTPFTQKSRENLEALVPIEAQHWPDRAHLHSGLTPEQRNRLPVLFLRLEGMSAVRRLEFQELIDVTLDQQRKIVELWEACSRDVYAPVARACFVEAPEGPLLYPSLISRRRLATVALDYQILSLLTAEQRAKLVPFTEEARRQAPLLDAAQGLVFKLNR